MAKSWRKIVVDDIEYKWQVGRNCVPIRRAEDNKVVATPGPSDITGIPAAEIERAVWKGYFHITPKQIADYIRENIHS